MKWNNKTKQVGFCLFLLLSVCATGSFSQEVSEELSDFTEVKVFNGVEVVVVPSDSNNIIITGHSKDKVKFEVVEDRLEIKLSLENIWSDDNTLIKVYVRNLKTIDANEGSIVEVPESLKGDSYTFRSQEGAAIYAALISSRVNVKAVSGGLVQLRGSTKDLDVEVNTGGKFFGEQLASEDAHVRSGTAGQTEVQVSEYIKATAKFGGTIHIYGNPEKIDRKTTLGGKILEKN